MLHSWSNGCVTSVAVITNGTQLTQRAIQTITNEPLTNTLPPGGTPWRGVRLVLIRETCQSRLSDRPPTPSVPSNTKTRYVQPRSVCRNAQGVVHRYGDKTRACRGKHFRVTSTGDVVPTADLSLERIRGKVKVRATSNIASHTCATSSQEVDTLRGGEHADGGRGSASVILERACTKSIPASGREHAFLVVHAVLPTKATRVRRAPHAIILACLRWAPPPWLDRTPGTRWQQRDNPAAPSE